MSDYEEAILNNPDDAEIYFNIGNVHLSRQQFELAHELFDKAIEIDGRNAKFYQAKGLTF